MSRAQVCLNGYDRDAICSLSNGNMRVQVQSFRVSVRVRMFAVLHSSMCVCLCMHMWMCLCLCMNDLRHALSSQCSTKRGWGGVRANAGVTK